jgi:hypothetical protein
MITTPVAQVVDNSVLKVKIPVGKKAGDSFVIKTSTGNEYTVIVPAGCTSGDVIDIMIPSINHSTTATATTSVEYTTLSSPTSGETRQQHDLSTVTVTKAAAGAGLAGLVVGTCLLGPVIGILVGVGTAYVA